MLLVIVLAGILLAARGGSGRVSAPPIASAGSGAPPAVQWSNWISGETANKKRKLQGCPPGQRGTPCASCPDGTYYPGAADPHCRPCANGFFCAPSSTSATSEPCPAGYYCQTYTDKGESTPKACPAGSARAGVARARSSTGKPRRAAPLDAALRCLEITVVARITRADGDPPAQPLRAARSRRAPGRP